MRKSEVIIGYTYTVKVSGQLVPVKITRESMYGGWDGVNTATGRSVRIKTAGRLRRHDRETVRPLTTGNAIDDPEARSRLIALRRDPESCPACKATGDLDRTVDDDTHTAEVICCTCNVGWTERYHSITGKLINVLFESGVTASA